MDGVRFYKEKDGNVLAVLYNNTWFSERNRSSGKPETVLSVEAIGAVFFYENSPVASTSTTMDYIHENLTRISEEEARRIHPNLFTYLDQEG